ncbi:hypothetical protein COW36_12690 [bacterium (Candidatus Blackallbacteria) CG17_big_fil_post_rev_8_21_14_2_50_48_46]|uniref:HTH tetR-type domain-containing protein n=1 Tax=bacterium (Candidatus Blackallbacteria) CG17_big_fil_post_rev_8_21_14_2_50_48_46 TaxID=2014261 RepID=A0A2M7G404_9BACT|nr:MAG: hypothetical protein COW64_02570 [bacterium (Candidatus Blackallbacteria) CG18_big_fil_WC_8_21_14_2_50_49_26]PIW16618.1 MAG: hypothetical protein COW36_12690 [bacterium (Candidatus Blackallbacteria) CG17_big_fil_post_rev_8_21_14_2_50_48_46]PIW46126.1 MAG: hypothetical protein COW20_17955 [bacterium (Candidatus Blackallbacteria) CG13_big_fil_rev_8_21_14_2_50_49_14]
MARPQRISNSDILQAARSVLAEFGPQQLTLEAVGQKVGLVPGTLMQRFGSKRGLLLTLLRARQEEIPQVFSQARSQQRNPLNALYLACQNLYQEFQTPQILNHHLSFLQTDLHDPEFREAVVLQAQTLIQELENSLKAAAIAELLSTGPSKPRAQQLYQSLQGCLLHWALLEPEPLPRAIKRSLQTMLQLWQPTGFSAPPEAPEPQPQVTPAVEISPLVSLLREAPDEELKAYKPKAEKSKDKKSGKKKDKKKNKKKALKQA